MTSEAEYTIAYSANYRSADRLPTPAADDQPFVISPSVKIYRSNTASNIL